MQQVFSLRSVGVIVFLIVLCSVQSQAQTSIAFIGHLNSDQYVDTLISKHEERNVRLPDKILWGQPPNSRKSWERLSTTFTYPTDWKDFRGSFFVDNINRDTISDIVIRLHGKVQNKESNSEKESYRDTTLFLTIFGEEPITSNAVVAVHQIQFNEQTKFRTREMKKGTMLLNEAHRDISGFKSYKVARVNTARQEEEEAQKKAQEQSLPIAVTPEISIFPNPAQTTLTIQCNGLASGEYSLDMMNVLGAGIHNYSFEISPKGAGTYSLQLDVSQFSSGVYILRVFDKNNHIISLPFTIHR